MAINKKNILLDLDGVLNKYNGEYDNTYIPSIRESAYKFVKDLSENYKIIIFTSRNLLLASKWLTENKLDKYIENITNIKEPAYLIIDDKCITFNGNYEELIEQIENFKVWYKN